MTRTRRGGNGRSRSPRFEIPAAPQETTFIVKRSRRKWRDRSDQTKNIKFFEVSPFHSSLVLARVLIHSQQSTENIQYPTEDQMMRNHRCNHSKSSTVAVLLLFCSWWSLSTAGVIVDINQDGYSMVDQYNDERNLQFSKVDDPSLPLFENYLVVSLSTPWSNGFDECPDGSNWDNGTKPENFTWYGLRLQLPDDAVEISAFWYSNVGSMVKEDGFQQLYGQDTPEVVCNINFTTTEANPTIGYNLNDDLLWETWQVYLDDVEDGEYVKTSKGYSTGLCSVEKTENSEIWVPAVDATFELAMARMQLREESGGSSSAVARSTSNSWASFPSCLGLFLALVGVATMTMDQASNCL
jgi:hypothetical protein